MEEFISQESSQKERYYGVGSFIFEVIKIVVLAFVIIIPIRVFLFQPFFVQGASMEPNFENNEYLIINEFGYKETAVGFRNNNFFTVKSFKDLNRGDVVVFRYPKNRSIFFIKRIIGLPGERVELRNSEITIFNNENPEGLVLNEDSYLSPNLKTNGDQIITLGSDQFYVMGDNRMYSSDSRAWGSVSRSDIIGKVLFRAWPLDRITVF